MYILASILLVVAAGLIFFTWPAPAPPPAPTSRESDLDAAVTDPIAAVTTQIENKHPATYFILARRLFARGEKDDAVFWFYVGLIRYRSYLAGAGCQGEGTRFLELWEALERPINDHAFGDIVGLGAAIGRALVWDDMHANPYAPRGAARDHVSNGLRRMKAEMLARQDAFRAARAAV